MKEDAMLHVITGTLLTGAQTGELLRTLRHMQPRREERRHMLLLVCDLPDAPACVMPDDAPLLRAIQSGVMAICARSQGETALLVRSRVWDDAARAFLGASQRVSPQETIALLLGGRQEGVSFACATISPASLKDRFSCVLFSDASLACTPDTPGRMRAALAHSRCPCLRARVLEKRAWPHSALSRLCAPDGFSLSPLHAVRQAQTALPAIYGTAALAASPDLLAKDAPLCQDCTFVRRRARLLPDFFAAHRRMCLHGSALAASLPLFQLALLFLGAALGLPLLCALAVLPVEWRALVHPRQLPGALLRLALLPMTALVSLDALLCRALAYSRLVRLRAPDALLTPPGCALFGAMLLPAALHGAQALAASLPICLLWLAAPLIIPAMDAPTIERIPLTESDAAQLRALGESAFFDSERAQAGAPRRMLRACLGCLLSLLEPDEAARQAEALLCALKDEPLPPFDHAALLASAQILREHMSGCDAALRALPAQIEARSLALPLLPSAGPLGALLCAARGEHGESDGRADPLDALFLPLGPVRETPRHALTLPLTHPHTYLKRHLLSQEDALPAALAVERFLALADAALGHPLDALLERSPVTGPFGVLMTIRAAALKPA